MLIKIPYDVVIRNKISKKTLRGVVKKRLQIPDLGKIVRRKKYFGVFMYHFQVSPSNVATMFRKSFKILLSQILPSLLKRQVSTLSTHWWYNVFWEFQTEERSYCDLLRVGPAELGAKVLGASRLGAMKGRLPKLAMLTAKDLQRPWRLSYGVKWVRERQMSYDITYTWNLKNGTNEHICKTEIESQM